jgi:hypothetical protein
MAFFAIRSEAISHVQHLQVFPARSGRGLLAMVAVLVGVFLLIYFLVRRE